MKATEIATVTVGQFKCLRCGHVWVARAPGVPVCCAGCKSPRWNLPKVERKAGAK